MDSSLGKLLIAIASLVAGHLLSRWWNRAKPVVVLRGFDEKQRTDEFVNIPEELSTVASESWFVADVESTAPVPDLQSVYEEAKGFVTVNKDSEKWCAKVKELLEAAVAPDEIAAAIRELLEHEGVKEMLLGAILSDAIRIKPSFDYTGESIITVSESDEADGSVLVVIERRYFRLGSGLLREGWRKRRLANLFAAIEFGDKQVMLQLVNALPGLIAAQREIHRRIIEIASPVIEGKSVWVAKLTIVNCGLSPMIMWPTARMIIKDPKSGAAFDIPCHLAIEKEDENAQDLIGVRVIPPSESINIWTPTDAMQDQMQSGAVLRTLYEAANVNAEIHLTISSRGWPFGNKVRSSKTLFGATASRAHA